MPVLYNTVESGATGRVLCAIFFLGLVFAGISSLIAIMEVGVHVLNDFGSEWSEGRLWELNWKLQHQDDTLYRSSFTICSLDFLCTLQPIM